MKRSDTGNTCAIRTSAALNAVDAGIGSPNILRWPNYGLFLGVPSADPHPSLTTGALFKKNIVKVLLKTSQLTTMVTACLGMAGAPAMRARPRTNLAKRLHPAQHASADLEHSDPYVGLGDDDIGEVKRATMTRSYRSDAPYPQPTAAARAGGATCRQLAGPGSVVEANTKSGCERA